MFSATDPYQAGCGSPPFFGVFETNNLELEEIKKNFALVLDGDFGIVRCCRRKGVFNASCKDLATIYG